MTPSKNVVANLEEIRAGVLGPRSHAFDEARIAHAVRELLLGLGEDPDRDGLADTPQRVARAYREIFAGLHANPMRHLTRTFAHEGGADDLMMMRDIEIFRMGLVPFYLMPFLEQADREGSALPRTVRWLTPVFCLEPQDDLRLDGRSERKP